MKRAIFCILTMFVCTGIFAQQPVVAVTPFNAISGISIEEANVITRVFTIRLGNTQKVSFVDRSIVERVLQEHRFQAGDWSNPQKTAEMGKALNADWIVRGELEKFGSSILVTVQFYNIQTFRFMGGGDIRIANADDAYDKMNPLVNKLIEAITNAQTATTRTYKVGDLGPAGGLVFYDKGNNTGGWRYFEAAPVETEKQMHWAGWYDGFDEKYHDRYTYKGFTHQASGTGTGIGNGKRNTQLIINNLKHYELWLPVHYCNELKYGGFNDWFLPSKDELDLMYRNLSIKGLGDFSSGEYWSSSEPVSGNLEEVNSGTWIQIFGNGKQEIGPLGEVMPYIRVRAVRAF